MPRWIVCAFVTLLALAAAPARAQGTAPNAADAPGCLGQSVDTCVRSLSTTMSLDQGFLAAALSRRHAVDVNGRPLGSGGMTISGLLPGRVERIVIVLKLGAQDTVASAEARLLHNLLGARTEADYDRSGLYEIVTRLLGRRCAGVAKLDLYRFFENQVKPRIASQRQDISGGLFGQHRLTAQAAGVPFCGANFTYTEHAEWHGSGEAPAGKNVTGYASILVQ